MPRNSCMNYIVKKHFEFPLSEIHEKECATVMIWYATISEAQNLISLQYNYTNHGWGGEKEIGVILPLQI